MIDVIQCCECDIDDPGNLILVGGGFTFAPLASNTNFKQHVPQEGMQSVNMKGAIVFEELAWGSRLPAPSVGGMGGERCLCRCTKLQFTALTLFGSPWKGWWRALQHGIALFCRNASMLTWEMSVRPERA